MATMSKTMTKFWMDSKIPEDSRWHSKHEGDFRTTDRLADHFVGKLRDQCRHEKSEVAIMVRFTRILKELLDSYESQANLLLKLADTGRVASLLHGYINNALDTLDILDPVEREEWHNQLLIERKERLQVFEDFVKDDKQLVAELGDRNQQLEIVTLLRYCVEKYHDGITEFAGKDEKYRDKLTSEELDTINIVYDAVVTKAGIVSEELPDWFVTSEHEWAWVNKAKLEDSKKGWDDKAREKDADDKVSEEERGEVCVRLASIWTELNHPHVRKFYGASYVGKPFVIHESCFPPTYEKERWRYWANCALGLQYVHDRGLVYYDVSPATLLCSYSERRGVLDGLGLVPRNRVDRLNVIGNNENENQSDDEESSVSCDVLRFGLSVFFLLMGARNSNFPTSKRDQSFDSWTFKTTTQLPASQPGFIKDAEWEMLLGLCAANPADRTPLEDVVFKMHALAEEESPKKKDPPQQPVEGIRDFVISSFDGTVADMFDEFSEKFEEGFSEVDRYVYDRLRNVYEQLEKSKGSLPLRLVETFSSLLWDFFLKVETESDGPSQAIQIASRSVAGQNYHYHHQIDHLVQSYPQLQGVDVIHRWQPTWDQAESKQRDMFLQSLKNPSTLLQQMGSPENIAMLRFEAQNRSGAYSPDVVEAMNVVLKEAEHRGIKNADVIPKWFIPSHQVKLGKSIGNGGFAVVHYGKWFGTKVVVKKLKPIAVDDDARDQFRREADLWFTLNHSNLIKLYGACYEGQQPFFVCERATRETLTGYLKPENGRRRELWFRLLQAALGIEHLHDHNIVHGDLKNNNILVCEGGAAKIADFGLSVLGTMPKDMETQTTEAVRWKAPECLMGEVPTFASDIYAFGMCIIEAVTGEYPWGKSMLDSAVAHAVKVEKKMPDRPAMFSKDKEWDLVTRMCRWDPTTRIGIGAVIKILEDIGVSNLIETEGKTGPTKIDAKTRST